MNNIEEILNFIDRYPGWHPDEWFYMLQVIQRSKDGHPKATKTIRTWYVDNPSFFDTKYAEVIELCNEKNARAYFNLNPKSYQETALHLNIALAKKLIARSYKGLENEYHSAAGLCGSEYRTWVVDVDGDYNLQSLENAINDCKPEGDHTIMTLPTKNGHHIISHPFNVSEFHTYYPLIEIHKNNPTLLYWP